MVSSMMGQGRRRQRIDSDDREPHIDKTVGSAQFSRSYFIGSLLLCFSGGQYMNMSS